MEFDKVLLIIENILKEIKPKVAIASLSSFEENLQEIKKFANEKGYCFNYLKFNDLNNEYNNVKLFKFFLEDKCLLNSITYSVVLRDNLNPKFINTVTYDNKNNNTSLTNELKKISENIKADVENICNSEPIKSAKEEVKNVSKNIKNTVTEVVNSEETLKTKEALKGFCDKVVSESKKIVADIKADKKNDIKKDKKNDIDYDFIVLNEEELKDLDEFIEDSDNFLI